MDCGGFCVEVVICLWFVVWCFFFFLIFFVFLFFFFVVKFGVSKEHFGSWMVGLVLVNWDFCSLVLVFSF